MNLYRFTFERGVREYAGANAIDALSDLLKEMQIPAGALGTPLGFLSHVTTVEQTSVGNASPSHAVRCPYGNHPIFVRENGKIVAHYDGEGKRCRGNERTYCDCHLHEHQVCDICTFSEQEQPDCDTSQAPLTHSVASHEARIEELEQLVKSLRARLDEARVLLGAAHESERAGWAKVTALNAVIAEMKLKEAK